MSFGLGLRLIVTSCRVAKVVWCAARAYARPNIVQKYGFLANEPSVISVVMCHWTVFAPFRQLLLAALAHGGGEILCVLWLENAGSGEETSVVYGFGFEGHRVGA